MFGSIKDFEPIFQDMIKVGLALQPLFSVALMYPLERNERTLGLGRVRVLLLP